MLPVGGAGGGDPAAPKTTTKKEKIYDGKLGRGGGGAAQEMRPVAVSGQTAGKPQQVSSIFYFKSSVTQLVSSLSHQHQAAAGSSLQTRPPPSAHHP